MLQREILNFPFCWATAPNRVEPHWLQVLESLVAVWIRVASHQGRKNQAPITWSLAYMYYSIWAKRCNFCIFVFCHGSADELVSWGWSLNHALIAYVFSNVSAKNGWNRFMCVEVIGSQRNYSIDKSNVYHGLRGSASPLLTATELVNGQWRNLSDSTTESTPLNRHQQNL